MKAFGLSEASSFHPVMSTSLSHALYLIAPSRPAGPLPRSSYVVVYHTRREQTTSTRDNVFIIRFYPEDDALSVYTTYVDVSSIRLLVFATGHDAERIS